MSLGNIVPKFGRIIPELWLCKMKHYNTFTIDLDVYYMNLIKHSWQLQQLEIFANEIHSKEASLDNCCGSLDGTVKPVYRPGRNQRIIHNGHKRIHELKVKWTVTPSGLIANLFGLVEGCRHDSAMLAMSQICLQLQQFSRDRRDGRCAYMPILTDPVTQTIQQSYVWRSSINRVGVWRYSELFCVHGLWEKFKVELSVKCI